MVTTETNDIRIKSNGADGVWIRNMEFTIVATPWVATLNSVDAVNGFATFCGSSNFTVNVPAYIAAWGEGSVSLTTINSSNEVIPAGEGVVLAGTAGANYTINYTTNAATADVTGNVLKGTTAQATTSTIKGSSSFLLAFNKTTNRFESYTGTNFPANKAYLLSNSALAPSLRIVDDVNNATTLDEIESTDNVVKFVQNGKLLIKRDGVVYDALGRVIRK